MPADAERRAWDRFSRGQRHNATAVCQRRCSEFPDGTPAQQSLWLDCCVSHDRAYWLGGRYAERQRVDEQLGICVAKVGEPEVALLMLAGVRVGGSPFWPTRFRWGYGWSYWAGWRPRGYRELSGAEWNQVKQLADAVEKAAGSGPAAVETHKAND